MRPLCALLALTGCTSPAPHGCGEATGSAATTSSAVLDPLVVSYSQSGGTWSGEMTCAALAPFDLTFHHEPVPDDLIMVPERALETPREGLVCPAAEADVEVEVTSEHVQYVGIAHLTLAPEGDAESVRVYVEEPNATVSIFLYLDGAAEARVVLGGSNEICTGAVVRS